MGSFSIVHWLIVLVVVLLVFGPRRLAGLGKALGDSVRELKGALLATGTPEIRASHPEREKKEAG